MDEGSETEMQPRPQPQLPEAGEPDARAAWIPSRVGGSASGRKKERKQESAASEGVWSSGSCASPPLRLASSRPACPAFALALALSTRPWPWSEASSRAAGVVVAARSAAGPGGRRTVPGGRRVRALGGQAVPQPERGFGRTRPAQPHSGMTRGSRPGRCSEGAPVAADSAPVRDKPREPRRLSRALADHAGQRATAPVSVLHPISVLHCPARGLCHIRPPCSAGITWPSWQP